MSLNEAHDFEDQKAQAMDRLRQRLMKIQTDFKQSAPHEIERQITDPILEALAKPTECIIAMGDNITAQGDFQLVMGDPAEVTTGAANLFLGADECPENISMDETATMDEVDAEAGVPDSSNFHLWLTEKFGFGNVPQFNDNPIYDDWPEWPESDTWPSAIEEDEPEPDEPEPDPMDIKGNNIAKRLAGLQAEMKKIEENKNVLVVEKDNLSNQLKACKKRIAELNKEQDDTLHAIEIAKEEQAKHIAELDELHMHNERKKREDDVITEIRRDMDDFSQAVQILLNSGKYCDLDQLIRAHIKNNLYVTDEVKRSIITEARYLKRDQLYASLEVENCYLAPKNEDGLPNLFDQYITDSYYIVYE